MSDLLAMFVFKEMSILIMINLLKKFYFDRSVYIW